MVGVLGVSFTNCEMTLEPLPPQPLQMTLHFEILGSGPAPGGPLDCQHHLPASLRTLGFGQATLSHKADLAPLLRAGKDATSAQTFLPPCAFLETFATDRPVLEIADAEMENRAPPLQQSQCTWDNQMGRVTPFWV